MSHGQLATYTGPTYSSITKGDEVEVVGKYTGGLGPSSIVRTANGRETVVLDSQLKPATQRRAR